VDLTFSAFSYEGVRAVPFEGANAGDRRLRARRLSTVFVHCNAWEARVEPWLIFYGYNPVILLL
jgi:hypothetical protein